MNEREKFIQSFYAGIAAFVDRISTMTETQVLAMLRGISASRNSQNQTLAFLNSVALNALEDTDDEINKLRSQLSSRGAFRRKRWIGSTGLH